MLAIVVVLNIISAGLPIAAILRLLARAQRDASARRARLAEHGRTIADLTAMVDAAEREPFERLSATLWDVGLVGFGVVIGAAANIWSLFL